MRLPRFLCLLALALLTSSAAAETPTGDSAAGAVVLNRIVAVVNDGIILSSELDSTLASVRSQLLAKGAQLPAEDVLLRQVLERLVVEKLQLQIADANGMAIDDSTLNSELLNIAQKNNMTLEEFRSVIEQEGAGYSEFREDIRKQLLIQELRRQMVSSRIKVSDLEVDNLLIMLRESGKSEVEYHLAHILVAIPEAAGPEQIAAAEQRAGNILARLRDNADFAQIAIAESDGQTALEGGDIGWRSIGQMPGLFVDPVQGMQPGDISDLIRSTSGFHIIKLIEKRGDERHIMRQTHARHILLKEDELHSDAENRARIQQLLLRLQGGEDFAELARTHSQDTISATRGGDLGWLAPGDTVPAFEKAMDELAPGEISKPVKSRFGWHIIQVLEYRDQDNTEEYERNRVRNLIRARKYDEELFLWLRRLRDEAYIEYRIDAG